MTKKRKQSKHIKKKNAKSFKASILIGCCILTIVYLSIFIFSYFSNGKKYKSADYSTVLASQTNTIVAKDTFQRSNQTHWGRASDGQNTWGADASVNSIYQITNNFGQISNGSGISNGVLGPSNLTDSQVIATVQVGSFTNTDIGVLLRYKDNDNWYKAYFDGSNFLIRRMLSDNNTVLTQTSFKAYSNNNYTIKFQVVGINLSAKVWRTSDSEPNNWMLQTSDDNFSSGYAGIGVSTQNGSVVKYSSFIAYDLTVVPTPTSARYTCDGNTGQCIPEPQGYYTTSNCNNACWGSLTQNPTPTPTSGPIVNHYSCNGNTGACQYDPQGYYTTSNCNMACWGYITPTSSITNNPSPTQMPTATPQPTQPPGSGNTPVPTNSFNTPSPTNASQDNFPSATPTQSTNPIQNAFSFLQNINPFNQSQPTPSIFPSGTVPSQTPKNNNLLYQEATYNPASMEFNFAKILTGTTKTPTTVFSFILNINNAIRNFFVSLIQGSYSKIINK